MANERKPVLITGSHRSGTTWAGKCLALAPRTGYIHEPFNIDLKFGFVQKPFEHWFQYICDENDSAYTETLGNVIGYRYPLIRNLAKAKTLMTAAKLAREKRRALLHKAKNDSPIIKDPIAIFSADWLSRTYDMNVLIMIRHPAAFCSSLKLKNWRFDFNHFLNQPLLMRRYLEPFEDKIRQYANKESSVVDQAVLLWNCIYGTVAIYRREHPEWLFVKHEDLSNDPVEQFQSIFKRFDLDFTSEAKDTIRKNSGSHNPTEQQPDNEFVRNSRANIHNWKKRLDPHEIDRIRSATCQVAGEFYCDLDW